MLRTSILAALLFCVVALQGKSADFHFFRYKGTVWINGKNQAPIENLFHVMVSNDYGSTSRLPALYPGFIPFFVGYNYTDVKINGNSVVMKGVCTEAGWGMRLIHPSGGNVILNGTWKFLTLNANCTDSDTKTTYTIKADVTYSPCAYYNVTEGGKRAQQLVGKKSDTINEASQVPNFAYRGFPYFLVTKTCKHFLVEFGKNSSTIKPGFVVAGLDATHCAMIDSEGDKFIQYNVQKQQVTIHPVNMLPIFFPKGYQIKEPLCE